MRLLYWAFLLEHFFSGLLEPFFRVFDEVTSVFFFWPVLSLSSSWSTSQILSHQLIARPNKLSTQHSNNPSHIFNIHFINGSGLAIEGHSWSSNLRYHPKKRCSFSTFVLFRRYRRFPGKGPTSIQIKCNTFGLL